MKKNITRFLFALFFLLASNAFGADTYFVSTSGSDGNTCAQANVAATPKRNIMGGSGGLACIVAGNGDFLDIRGGTYNEDLNHNVQAFPSGTSYANAATIRAHVGESVVVRSMNVVLTSRYIIFERLIVDGNLCGTGCNELISVGAGANHIRLIDIEGKNNQAGQISALGPGSSFVEVIRPNFHDSAGAKPGITPSGGYCIYISGNDNLVEDGEFSNCIGYGIHIFHADGTEASRNVIRRNRIHGMVGGGTFNTGTGLLLGTGNANQAYQNIIYGNTGNGIELSNNATNSVFHSNTVVGNNTSGIAYGGLVYGTGSGLTIKNNILYQNTAGDILDSNGVQSPAFGGNWCTGSGLGCAGSGGNPLFVNQAGANFGLLPNSPAKNTGTGNITASIQLSCSGACDPGVYEIPDFASCSAVGNTLSLVFNNPRFPPIANLSVTGLLSTIDSTLRTNSAPTLVGTNQVDITFSGAAVSAAAASQGTGGGVLVLSDSANIGHNTANVQRVGSWASTPCTVTPTVGIVLTQISGRFHDLPGAENAPKCLSASGSCSSPSMQNVPAKIQAGGCFRCRLKAACTGAACGPGGYIFRYSRNGGGYIVVPDAFDVDNIKYYGTADTSSDIPSQGTVTTQQLTNAQPTIIPGSIVRTSVAIPNLNFTLNSEAELEAMFCIDRDEASGTTYDFRLYNQNGAALDAYTVTPRATVVSPALTNGVGFMSKLDPWDMQIILGSNLAMGKPTKRTTDSSSFVYPTVPKSARVIYIQ